MSNTVQVPAAQGPSLLKKALEKTLDKPQNFGEETSYVRGTTKPYAARIAKATATNGKIKVTLAAPAAGAEKYAMCYSKTSDFAKYSVGIRTTYTTRTFTKALSKGTYYVRVKSYRDLSATSRIYGDWSNTVKVVVK